MRHHSVHSTYTKIEGLINKCHNRLTALELHFNYTWGCTWNLRALCFVFVVLESWSRDIKTWRIFNSSWVTGYIREIFMYCKYCCRDRNYGHIIPILHSLLYIFVGISTLDWDRERDHKPSRPWSLVFFSDPLIAIYDYRCCSCDCQKCYGLYNVCNYKVWSINTYAM